MRRCIKLEKHGKRCRFDPRSDVGQLDIRDVAPSSKPGILYHGGLFLMNPTEALELAAVLTEWAEHRLQLGRAKRARARAKKAS